MCSVIRIVSAAAALALAGSAGALPWDGAPVSTFEAPCPSVCTCDLRGDANGDCEVDIDDLLAVLSGWGSSCGQPGFNRCADLDGDCTIGQGDLDIVLADFGNHC